MTNRLGPLAEPSFRYLWLAVTTSSIGDALMPVTMVLAVLAAGGGATEIGLVLAVSTTVRAVFLLFGGVVADRMPRRAVLLTCDLVLAVTQATLAVVVLTGHGGVGLLLAAAVVYALGAALSKPAMTGLVPQSVPPARLQQANAQLSLAQNTARVVGPALGGLIAAVDVGWAYALDAVTFLASAAFLALVRVPAAAAAERGSFLSDLAIGWREVTTRRWYWCGLICHSVWNTGFCFLLVLGPGVVLAHHTGTAGWGLVSAGLAMGSLLGGALALRWRPRRPLVVAHLALIVTAVGLASLLRPEPMAVIVGAVVLGAAGVALANELWVTAMQQLIPAEVLSRVSSYDWLVSFVMAPVGYAVAGPLAERVGVGPALQAAIVLLVAPCLLILLVPAIRQLRQRPDGVMELPAVPTGHPAPAAATPLVGSGWPETQLIKEETR